MQEGKKEEKKKERLDFQQFLMVNIGYPGSDHSLNGQYQPLQECIRPPDGQYCSLR
jgi:hypothetical protein